MLWLYRLLFVPVLLATSPRYLRRMRRRGGYRANFGQRFGLHRDVPGKPAGMRRVWLQAVSVGEVNAVGPILDALYRQGVEVYLTTTTSTGYAVANDKYRGITVGIGYFPLDWWPVSARAWRAIEPDLAIITEGERWPEHAHQAKARGVPVIAINARLSDRSFGLLRRFPSVARLLLDGISRVLACSAPDESRFRQLGYPADRLQATGNIKLDLVVPPLDEEAREQLRRDLGIPSGLVLLGASTWPGEEEALIDALKFARSGGARCSLALVPRHAERRYEIGQALRRAGMRYHPRTRGSAAAEVDVALCDTTGEMRNLLQIADLVFVGKSLPPHTDGQTPVEAAALGKPVMFGPGMANFRVIARDLLDRGAALEVANAPGLAAASAALLRDSRRREALGAAAATWRRDNAGAVDRTLAVIWRELAKLQI